ncbi:MAG: hypothetical protein K6F23_03425 [Solobacterium sp.]|nr:hypothetical protein [Solobacterium sp.]
MLTKIGERYNISKSCLINGKYRTRKKLVHLPEHKKTYTSEFEEEK